MHQTFRLTLGMVFILTLSTGEEPSPQYYGGYGGWGGETASKAISPEGGGLLRTQGRASTIGTLPSPIQ